MAEPPVRVLLDTHVIIWALTEPQRLSATAREIIESRENELLVSAASAWEIGTKYRLGKLPQLEATVLNFEAQLDTLGTNSLPVSTAHALLAGTMAWSHADPFDRMLAAQAILEAAPLVTSDSVFTRLEGVDVVW
ncbi:MAG TPA: type II toxin-antitoxin system VapC family toxin [Rhodoglobus sp.]|nr:type II toxin-antitoxin system VapC family toxin [Rhodoglobus sp.]HQA23882.1 type II toxin-antitoxin system VapC family toxin [Rhodoglobus sp.]